MVFSVQGDLEMPGKKITDQQYRLYMTARKLGSTQKVSSAKAGISERSGKKLEKERILPSQKVRKIWKTRKDPFEEVWEEKLVPLLKETPHLSAITLLEHLQQEDSHDQYSDSLLRTLQRRVRKWRALHGKEQEIMFRQIHVPGRQGLSDFTTLKGIKVTIKGEDFPHLLYHFRLAFSKWSWMRIVQGGESFRALSQGLQDALWQLGGSPEEHRTDSLSAAFKNLSRDTQKDTTRSYEELCGHYGMKPSRNNPGKGHENGSIESSHGHLKRRIAQEFLLRRSYDFESVSSYQTFIETVVKRHNRRHKNQIDVERQFLKELPKYRSTDFKKVTAHVNTSSTILVDKVVYSVPSRLIGQRLCVHVYNDHLSCYLGNDSVIDLPRAEGKENKKKRCINYKHLIGSLSRKPQAFRYSVLRDDLLPTQTYKKIWKHIDEACSVKHACKLMVGILKLAADNNCEQELGETVLNMLKKGNIPCLGTLQKKYDSSSEEILHPAIKITQHTLQSYNQLIPSLTQEVIYA